MRTRLTAIGLHAPSGDSFASHTIDSESRLFESADGDPVTPEPFDRSDLTPDR